MMWLNIAKNFLAAYAAKDVDELKKLVADGADIADICDQDDFCGKYDSFFDYYKIYSKYSKKIEVVLKKTAYNNKTVFIEFECSYYNSLTGLQDYREGVLQFEIDMNKIQRLDFYRKRGL